ncbi:MAG: histidine kinase [Filomicrobium sp.]
MSTLIKPLAVLPWRIGAQGKSTRLGQWWRRQTLRWQLLTAFAAITLAATLAATTFLIADARNRTLAETTAALDIAEELVRTASENISSQDGVTHLLDQIVVQFSEGRHVRVIGLERFVGGPVRNADTARIQMLSEVQTDEPRSLFLDVLGLQPEMREVSIRVGSELVANVLLASRPSDEFGEAWTGLQTIGLIWLVANAGIIAILYFVLGYVLRPLSSVALGMEELEREQAGIRVEMPRTIELQRVVHSFNHLAENLEYARSENSQLFRKVMEVQEKERRRIAGELHDEIGPCLFGIMSSVSSIKKLCGKLPPEELLQANDRIAELGEICDRLKQSNRSILNGLYPITVGHITIGQLLQKLLREYSQRHPEIDFISQISAPQRSYGEDRDLLLYRAVQEGVTNAMRHGRAKTITVFLQHQSAADPLSPLVLEIEDDGRGLPETFQLGFGLTTMRMRLQACGGSFGVSLMEEGGVRLRLVVPAVSDIDQDSCAGGRKQLPADGGLSQ